MSEVKRYVTTCDCMSDAAWGDYVRYEDYARLEQECKDAKCQAELMQRAAEAIREERDAALKQVEGLRALLEDISGLSCTPDSVIRGIESAMSAKP